MRRFARRPRPRAPGTPPPFRRARIRGGGDDFDRGCENAAGFMVRAAAGRRDARRLRRRQSPAEHPPRAAWRRPRAAKASPAAADRHGGRPMSTAAGAAVRPRRLAPAAREAPLSAAFLENAPKPSWLGAAVMPTAAESCAAPAGVADRAAGERPGRFGTERGPRRRRGRLGMGSRTRQLQA